MILDYNVTKEKRKKLVEAISEITGMAAEYQGVPDFSYHIGEIKVNRAGKVDVPLHDAVSLIEALREKGFEAVDSLKEIIEKGSEVESNMKVEEAENMAEENTAEENTAVPDGHDAQSASAESAENIETETGENSDSGVTEDEPGITCISMPRSLLPEAALENLKKLVEAKRNLICKALGVDELPIEETEDKISFPWFRHWTDPEELKAYMHFITALCDMARNAKRVTATEKDTDNEKYAFRCFLLRLGFIGNEYKAERKVLLARLSGNSAFKGKGAKEVE